MTKRDCIVGGTTFLIGGIIGFFIGKIYQRDAYYKSLQKEMEDNLLDAEEAEDIQPVKEVDTSSFIKKAVIPKENIGEILKDYGYSTEEEAIESIVKEVKKEDTKSEFVTEMKEFVASIPTALEVETEQIEPEEYGNAKNVFTLTYTSDDVLMDDGNLPLNDSEVESILGKDIMADLTKICQDSWNETGIEPDPVYFHSAAIDADFEIVFMTESFEALTGMRLSAFDDMDIYGHGSYEMEYAYEEPGASD